MIEKKTVKTLTAGISVLILAIVGFESLYSNYVNGDGDGVINSDDNCLTISNPTQSDFDGDKIGDECDPDYDKDGIGDNADFDDEEDDESKLD